MRIVKQLSFALVVACSAAVTASAHQFEYSKTGLLLATADNTQVFKFNGKEYACTKLTADGVINSLKFLTQKATVLYTGCSTPLGGTIDEPITAEYEYSADNTVNILKPINIFILKALLGECHITIEAQNSLKTVTYDNNASGDILQLSNITSIKSSGLGGGCTYALESNMTYTGNALVFLDGGTIKWV